MPTLSGQKYNLHAYGHFFKKAVSYFQVFIIKPSLYPGTWELKLLSVPHHEKTE